MEEEIKNPELERILDEPNKRSLENPNKQKMIDIIKKGGGRFIEGKDTGQAVYMHEDEHGKRAIFLGEYKKREIAERELGFVLDYLNKNGYQYHLD
jgi:hypothetical protein